MNRSSYVFLALALFFAAGEAAAQMSAGYSSLIFPHSVVSAGMGEQSVTMRNAADAMQSNPATLVYTEPGSVSFFRNPWMILGYFAPTLPITSVSTSLALSNGAHVGLEYTNWDFGDIYYSTEENPMGDNRHFYQRSIAGAYAMPLGSEWAVGAHLRYAWMPVERDNLSNDILFSAGATYTPEALDGRLHAGASLMNFGMPTDAYQDPMPAQFNLAADGTILRQPLYDVTLALGFTKPLDKREMESGRGYSSFKSLFTDWEDFPNGITTHIGLGYIWKPLPLGAGVSFFQEMYLGCFFTGLSEGNNSFFTHGVRAGIEAWGVKASAGYAGRWHNNHNSSYMPWVFPWETVQFTLSTDQPLWGSPASRAPEAPSLHSTIVSGGYARCVQTGRMKEETTADVTWAYKEKSVWTFESDFYLNEHSALTASLSYAYLNAILRPTGYIDNQRSSFEFGIETFSFLSGYRYHPVEALQPLFLQASVGITRLNPIARSVPRYSYKLVDELALGYVLIVPSTNVAVMPTARLKSLWMETPTDADKLGGFNQFEFGVNLGYRF